jgi:hypothetical protein
MCQLCISLRPSFEGKNAMPVSIKCSEVRVEHAADASGDEYSSAHAKGYPGAFCSSANRAENEC